MSKEKHSGHGSHGHASKDKDTAPGTTVVSDETISGGDKKPPKDDADTVDIDGSNTLDNAIVINHEQEHPLLTPAEALLMQGIHLPKGGILNFISLISSLLSSGAIADVMNIIALIGNDSTTLGQLKAAITTAWQHIFNNQTPVPPRMVTHGRRLSREEILAYMTEHGVNTQFIPAPVLGLLISMAIQYGLPLLLKLIEKIRDRQASGLKF